jgi:hypothetical protein
MGTATTRFISMISKLCTPGGGKTAFFKNNGKNKTQVV